MSKKAWIILLVCIAAVGFLGFLNFRSKAVVPVKTVIINKGSITSKIFPTGVVKAGEQVKISSKTGGKLVYLGVEEGNAVKKGELIARTDDAELIAQLSQAEANLEQTKVDLVTNQKNYERMLKLFLEKVITEQQMDNAEAQLKISQARIKQIEGQIDLIKVQIENTKIISPISGIVFQKFVNAGEMVNPGVPLVTVYNPSTLNVEVNVDEADVGKIKIGQRASIVLDAYPGEVVYGVVSYIASASQDVKEKGVTFIVRITVGKSGVVLRLGMTADVDVFVATHDNVVKVLLDAVQEKEGKKYVYTVENGKAKRKEIKLGLENDEEAEVIEGLKEGEEIISGNLDRISDSRPVKLAK
jgi:RND family efflux transporter MFP subunit